MYLPPSDPTSSTLLSAPYRADKLDQRLTTHAFDAAISAASEFLPSKTSLYLAPGAVLRFTGDPQDHTHDWDNDAEGRSGTYWISTVHNSTDVKIFGWGTIDTNAYPHKDASFAQNIIVPVLTSHFILDGPVLRESGSTALNIVHSNSVDIRNLKVFNRIEDMTDNSSVDVVESQNVTVSHAIAISLSDTFTAKATKPPSDTVPTYPGALQPLEDVLFQNCLDWTANYGFKVGQGAMSDMSNIKFFNSTVYDSAVGMGIHKKWGKGTASNVTFENMIIKTTSYTTSHLNGMVGLWIALFVENGEEGVVPITNVHVKSVLVGAEGGSQPLVSGVDGANVSKVEFRDIWLPKATYPASSLQDLDLENLNFASNITVLDDLTACQVDASSTTEHQTRIEWILAHNHRFLTSLLKQL